MKPARVYVREGHPYKKSELVGKFGLGDSGAEECLSRLLSQGVLAPVKEGASEFQFVFVGILFFGSLVLCCYPKYIRGAGLSDEAFAQVMNVIRRYDRESRMEFQSVGQDESTAFGLLGEALSLLDRYAERGIYSNAVRDSERDGSGEILWDRTIGSVTPFLVAGNPFYMEFVSRRTVDDESRYATRVHKVLLAECSRLLEEVGLLELFGVAPVFLSDESRESLGPDDYIVQRLRSELDIEFDSQKQDLLRQLIRFVEGRESLSSEPLRLYGTTAFERVWEAACAKGFGNRLKTPLGKLGLPAGLSSGYWPETRLEELIEKPAWHLEGREPEGGGTLVPDIATFSRRRGETVFLILDAKYYDPERRLPGIGDIDKQYLYQLAFRRFLGAHGIEQVRNVFLMPADGAEGPAIVRKGFVEFRMLRDLGLENIQLVLVRARELFSRYLEGGGRDFVGELLDALEGQPAAE